MTIDRVTARALTDAGYMPLSEYIRMFGCACDDAISRISDARPVHGTEACSEREGNASPDMGADIHGGGSGNLFTHHRERI